MKKQIISLISAGALMIILLSGCGGTETTAEVSSIDYNYASTYEDSSYYTSDYSFSDTELVSSEETTTNNTSKAPDKIPDSMTSKPNNTQNNNIIASSKNETAPILPDTSNKPDNSKVYQQKLKEENNRHQNKMNEIKRKYNSQIDSIQSEIDYYEKNYDIYPYSQSRYEKEHSDLEQEINQKLNRVALLKRDTSGVYRKEIAKLESEIKDLSEELGDLMTSWKMKEKIIELENTIKSYNEPYYDEIDVEILNHMRTIIKLKNTYLTYDMKQIKYYKEYPNVPDFGAPANIQHDSKRTGENYTVYVYSSNLLAENDASGKCLEEYGYILYKCGFTLDKHYSQVAWGKEYIDCYINSSKGIKVFISVYKDKKIDIEVAIG